MPKYVPATGVSNRWKIVLPADNSFQKIVNELQGRHQYNLKGDDLLFGSRIFI